MCDERPTAKPNRSPLRGSIWLTYVAIFAASIPWYWPADDQTLWLGMPAWAAVALLGSSLLSTFTALLIWRCWPPPDEDLQQEDCRE